MCSTPVHENGIESKSVPSGLGSRVLIVRLCFFFSSRRRHTRLQGDWSSDVCSSDLGTAVGRRASSRGGPPGRRGWRGGRSRGGGVSRGREGQGSAGRPGSEPPGDQVQIGRAAGRGRGEISGGAGSFKKKKKKKRGERIIKKKKKKKKIIVIIK